jgi:6-pyruvoyltetrahydropterin/6-carboxytetrahydropterin synthase
MNLTIMKQIGFCAGHRLMNHGGKCENLHGHNYIAQIFVTGKQTDSIGRVVDFGVIKQLYKAWIDENWDHAMILWQEDRAAIDALRLVQPHRLHVLPWNPTAENMARYLLEIVTPELLAQIPEYQIQVSSVVIWETDTSRAEAAISVTDNPPAMLAEDWQNALD